MGTGARPLWVWRGWKTLSAHMPLPGSVAEGQEDTILSYEPVTRQESKFWRGAAPCPLQHGHPCPPHSQCNRCNLPAPAPYQHSTV